MKSLSSLSSLLSVALAVTLVVEVPIVALFYPRQRFRMALACVVATVAATLVLNLTLARLPVLSVGGMVLTGEAIAVIGEAAVYAFAARGNVEESGWPRALVASLVANLASYAAGWFLLR